MSNKQTAPKELYLHNKGAFKKIHKDRSNVYLAVNKNSYHYDIKYIHSSEVERLLAEKDAEIEALKTKLEIRENLNRTANREDI